MSDNSQIRILVAEDHQITLTGILTILKNDTRLNIVASAKTGHELLKYYFELLPDLVITDIAIPGLTGLAAVKRIKERDKKVKILFLSMYYSQTMFRNCVNAGGQRLINFLQI